MRSGSWSFSFLDFSELQSSIRELLDGEQVSPAVEIFDLRSDEAPEAEVTKSPGFESTFFCYSLLSPDK